MIKSRNEIEFDEYISPDGVTYRLNGVAGKFVLSHTGLGMPPIDYVTQRGPFQHGVTPLGFRLGPRYIQYTIRQQACSRDGYWDLRSALIDSLRPNRQVVSPFTPGTLRKILPDGSYRDINVLFDSGLVYSPRSLDKWDEWGITDTIRLVAHDPTFFAPTIVTFDFEIQPIANLIFGIEDDIERTNLITNPSFEVDTTGWTSANTIARTGFPYVGSYSMVVTYVATQTLAYYTITLPTINQTYFAQARIYVPSTWDGGDIYIRTSGFAASTDTTKKIWYSGLGTDDWFYIGTTIDIAADLAGNIEIYTDSAPSAGIAINVDAVMVQKEDLSGDSSPYFDGDHNWSYWTGTEHASTSIQTPASKVNPVDRAVFPIWFGTDMINKVAEVTYNGTWHTYPIIYIYGPINYPTIYNHTTQEKVQLEVFIGYGQSATINLQYGNKTMLSNSGQNLFRYLSYDSDIGSFHIAPSPEAPGGVNQLQVTGSFGVIGETNVVIEYYTRYIGI